MYMVGVSAGAEPAPVVSRAVVVWSCWPLEGWVVWTGHSLCNKKVKGVETLAQTTNANLRQTSCDWRWGVGGGVLPWYHSSSIEELQRGDSLRPVKKVSSGSLGAL